MSHFFVNKKYSKSDIASRSLLQGIKQVTAFAVCLFGLPVSDKKRREPLQLLQGRVGMG